MRETSGQNLSIRRIGESLYVLFPVSLLGDPSRIAVPLEVIKKIIIDNYKGGSVEGLIVKEYETVVTGTTLIIRVFKSGGEEFVEIKALEKPYSVTVSKNDLERIVRLAEA